MPVPISVMGFKIHELDTDVQQKILKPSSENEKVVAKFKDFLTTIGFSNIKFDYRTEHPVVMFSATVDFTVLPLKPTSIFTEKDERYEAYKVLRSTITHADYTVLITVNRNCAEVVPVRLKYNYINPSYALCSRRRVNEQYGNDFTEICDFIDIFELEISKDLHRYMQQLVRTLRDELSSVYDNMYEERLNACADNWYLKDGTAVSRI